MLGLYSIQNILFHEQLPANPHENWITFRTVLKILNIKISRYIYYGKYSTNTQLHIFADVSVKAYGAASYIRATLRDDRVIVRLLCTQTHVAALKQQSIPQVELCAALLAAQLAHRIKTAIQAKISLYSYGLI